MQLAKLVRHPGTTPRRASALCAAALCILPMAGSPDRAPPERVMAVPAAVGAGIAPAEGLREAADDAPARVALGPGGLDLRLAGDFTDGVADRVARLLADNPEVRRIHLTSDGGLVEEAEAVGALVAGRGLDTYVPDACASACTLVFVRGRRRYLAAGAGLGFHAPYEDGPSGGMVTVDAAPERAAYAAAGIGTAFVARALAVPSEKIWTPDAAELRAAGVVTEMVGTDRFPDSTLDADPAPAAARAAVNRNLPILADADADTVDALAAWYRDGYAAGRSEAEAIEGLRRMTSGYLRRRFETADDATLRALAQAVLTALHGSDGGACAAVAQRDWVTLDGALRSARTGAPGLGPLVARMPSRATVLVSDATHQPPAPHPAKGCVALIAEIRRALARPRDTAATLRPLLLRPASADVAALAHP